MAELVVARSHSGGCCAVCAVLVAHWCVCHCLELSAPRVIAVLPWNDGPAVLVSYAVEIVWMGAEQREQRGWVDQRVWLSLS